MSYLGRLPPELMRKRYAQMHRMLQASIGEKQALKDRIAMLEAEAKALRIERDALLCNCEQVVEGGA